MGKKRSAWRGKFKHLFWLLHTDWTRIYLMKMEDWLNSQSPHLVIKQILVPFFFFFTRNHFTITRIWYRSCPLIWIGDSIHRLSVKSLPVNRITSSPSSMDDPGASCNAVLPSPFTARGLAPLHRQICKWKKWKMISIWYWKDDKFIQTICKGLILREHLLQLQWNQVCL